MFIYTSRKSYGIVCIIMGVLVLVLPKGWDDHPMNKLFWAAFFIGIGWLCVKKG